MKLHRLLSRKCSAESRCLIISRPFSYNDENFTVIGNVLFGHILLPGPVKAKEKICLIPPEIARRLIQFSAQGICQTPYPSAGMQFYGAIVKESDKYYIISNTNIAYLYYVTFYLFLKDI